LIESGPSTARTFGPSSGPAPLTWDKVEHAPASEVTSLPVQDPQQREYVVVAGDTLTSIARRYGLTPAELARHNNIDVNGILRVGQRLKLPPLRD
jgi:LysM repeat protein